MNNDNKTYNKRAFTVKEASEYACVSRTTVENWMANKMLPFEKLPGRGKGSYCFKRIRKADLDDFLNKFYQSCYISKTTRKYKSNELFLIPHGA